LKGTEDVGLAIVHALMVESRWVQKNIDSILLKKTLEELEEKHELGEKILYSYLERQLRHLAEIHKNLKEIGEYAPATCKPKAEEAKTAALMVQVNTLKKDLKTLKGGGNSGGGGTSGGKKFDKTNVQCHACKGKGHMKYDKECPKYAETMAKKNQSGGGNSNGNGGGGGDKKSGKNAWKYTKTTDVVERNGQKFYWCPKCNGGKGMYVSSHGPGHPSKPAHDDNFRANTPQQPVGQQNLAVDTADGEGTSISFGGIDFYTPAGLLCFFEEASCDEVHPKAFGR
jgi:hypothetical protein